MDLMNRFEIYYAGLAPHICNGGYLRAESTYQRGEEPEMVGHGQLRCYCRDDHNRGDQRLLLLVKPLETVYTKDVTNTERSSSFNNIYPTATK